MNEPDHSSMDDAYSNSAFSRPLFAVGLVLALVLAWMGRIILLLLFAAAVFAILLTAIVDWVKVKLKIGRKLAFTFILSAGAILVVLAMWLSGPNIIDQFVILQRDLPKAFEGLLLRLNTYSWGHWGLSQWSDYSQLSSSISYAVTSLGGFMLSTASLVAGLMIVAFLSLYLAAEPEVYYSGLRRATPRCYRATLDACATSAVRNLRFWLLAQLLSMVAIGTLVTVGLWILGVPLAGTLGVIAALMTFIPNLGPILSVVPAALLALAVSPTKGLLTILLFLVVHFLEGNIITPLLQRKIVRLPPALTLVVQLLLAVVAGPVGVALAAPFTAAMLGVFEVLLPADSAQPASAPTGD